MYLEYGVDDHGELVDVGQVARGKTKLCCPYCGGLLLARKGHIKNHHFAHLGESCRQVSRDPSVIAVPGYDNFNLHLPPRALKALREFVSRENGDIRYLEHFELIRFNQWIPGGEWELTKKAKLVLGSLSLMLFNEFQEPFILKRHDELHERVVTSASIYGKVGDLKTNLVDLRLYRAQWQRILSTNLYFLEVQHSSGILHKIGVSTRNVDERVAEVKRDLSKLLDQVQIAVLGVWAHRGNVELYFKYRYKHFNHPLGALTEYYKFDDVKPVLRDLRRMKEKQLSELELQVMRGETFQVKQLNCEKGLMTL